MSSGADIRDIDALNGLKAAFGRFGEDVTQIQPAIQKQLEQVQEWLDERQRFWEHQADQADAEVFNARNSLNECQSQSGGDDDEDYEPYCSFEEDQLREANRHLAECEANLETAKQWRHRIESQIADFQGDMQRLSHLASERTGSAQVFLASKIEILGRYTGGGPSALAGQVQGGGDKIDTDVRTASATAQIREKIRKARYTSSEPIEGGINQKLILKNKVKVVFKPKDGEYPNELRPGIRPGTQYLREKAASYLDELLGLGLVPPTETISYNGGEGSAQLFKDGFDTAKQLHKTGTITFPIFDRLTDRQRQDWQLLDELLGQMDRNSGNWMLRARADSGFDIALIDNGLCLSETGKTHLRARPASQQKLDTVNRVRLERFCSKEMEWRPKFCDLVGVAATEQMIMRAQNLLNRGYYD